MANIHTLDKYNINNLISGDGIVLDVENDIIDENEQYMYSDNIPMTPDEMVNALNLGDDMNEDDVEEPFIAGQGNGFNGLKEKMEDISKNGKVYKHVIRKGVGEIVPANSRVFVKYVGYFEYSDEPFDSTACHNSECMSIRLNNGEVIMGLDLGISSMKKHEVAAFLIHPDYAYGKLGCLPRIPPNVEIYFRVSLVDYVDDSKVITYNNLSFDDKQSLSNIEDKLDSLLKSAKDYFKRKNIRQAIRDYNRARDWLERVQLKNDAEEDKMKKMISRVHSNLAICYLEENKPRYAVRSAHMIYEKYHTAKTRFNLGKALGQMGEYDEAMVQLQKALELDSKNSVIREEIVKINDKKVKYAESEKKLWANCLNQAKEKKCQSSFEKAAEELCEMVMKDTSLCRHPLPNGLTPEEDKFFRQAAASQGLNVTEEIRYGKKTVYISKNNF